MQVEKLMVVFDFGLHPHMLSTAMKNQSGDFAFKIKLSVKLESSSKVVFLVITCKKEHFTHI